MTQTERRDFDLAIVCDAGAIERVGKSVRPVVEATPLVMDIDHHVADGPFGDIRILDATAAATAELVWMLLLALQPTTGAKFGDERRSRLPDDGHHHGHRLVSAIPM